MSSMLYPPGNRSLAALSLTAGLLFGCSQTADLPPALSESTFKVPGADSAGAGGQSGGAGGPYGGAGGQYGGAGGAAGQPEGGASGEGAGGSPGDGVTCTMREQGRLVCVTCVDVVSGKTVRDDCHQPGAGPNGATCEETRSPDGSSCVICKDPAGNVIKRGCDMPPTTCPVPSPPSPPGGQMGGACRETDTNGLKCVVCMEAGGKEVQRSCEPPAGMPPDPVACTDTSYPDGTTCSVCTDAQGNIIKKGCWSPVPAPPGPSMVTCKQYDQNGAHCTVCVDAAGTVVRQGCGPVPTPTTMAPPPPGMMTLTPPPGMTTMTPPPAPPVSCQSYENATSSCTICVDPAGKIVKQDCHPASTAPAPTNH